VTPSPGNHGRDLIHFLAASGIWPDRVCERQQNLEEIFLSLTGNHDGAAN